MIVRRIAGNLKVNLKVVPQDEFLANNQSEGLRCGDNGIFKGVPLSTEEKELSKIAREIYQTYPYDGKYVLDDKKLTLVAMCYKRNMKKPVILLWLILWVIGLVVPMLTPVQLIVN